MLKHSVSLKHFQQPRMKKSSKQIPNIDIIQYCRQITQEAKDSYFRLDEIGKGSFGSVRNFQNNTVIKIQQVSIEEKNRIKGNINTDSQIQQEIYFLSQIKALLSQNEIDEEITQKFLLIQSCEMFIDYQTKQKYYFLQFLKYQTDLQYNINQSDQNNKVQNSILVKKYLDLGKDEYKVDQRYLQMSIDLFQQLSFLHKNQIIHGDIKPDNILVNLDRNFQQINEELQTFSSMNRDIQVVYTLSDYGLTTYEYNLAENFNKLFAHPVLQIYFQTKLPALRRSDVYSLGLTLLTIILYKENQRDFRYYVNNLKKYLEQDKKYSPEDYEEELHKGFLDMLYFLRTDSKIGPDNENYLSCLEYKCVLFKLLQQDINQVPNSWDVLKFLNKFKNNNLFIQKFKKDFPFGLRFIDNINNSLQRVTQRCPNIDQQNFYVNNGLNFVTFLDKCEIKKKSNKKYSGFDFYPQGQIVQETLAYISQKGNMYEWQYALYLYGTMAPQLKNFINMDYDHFSYYDARDQEVITNRDYVQIFTYYFLNFRDLGHPKLQQVIELDEFVTLPLNFISLFEGLGLIHDKFFVFQSIDPRTIVQTIYFEKLSHLKLRMLPLPVCTANTIFQNNKQHVFFQYPLVSLLIYPQQADIYSLSLTCLYILYRIFSNRREGKDINNLIFDIDYNVTREEQIQNIRQKILDVHLIVFERNLDLNVQDCMELKDFPDNLVCFLIRQIKADIADIEDCDTIVSNLKQVKAILPQKKFVFPVNIQLKLNIVLKNDQRQSL